MPATPTTPTPTTESAAAWVVRIVTLVAVLYAAFVRPDPKPTDPKPMEDRAAQIESNQMHIMRHLGIIPPDGISASPPQ